MIGAKEMIDEIIANGRKILALQKEFEKRYGIQIISVTPDGYIAVDDGHGNYKSSYNGVRILVRNGMKELSELLGQEIIGSGQHYSMFYRGCDICVVTNGGRRFLKAKRRNNKWTQKV